MVPFLVGRAPFAMRYLVVIFPVLILLDGLGRRPWLHRSWLLASLVPLTFLLYQFLTGNYIA